MTEEQDKYERLASKFMKDARLGPEYDGTPNAQSGQFSVFLEEVEELLEAYNRWEVLYSTSSYRPGKGSEKLRADIAEEIADVLVTVHILGQMMDIDVPGAYEAKMRYNLLKTDVKDGEGKVTDDVDAPKPEFESFVGAKDEY